MAQFNDIKQRMSKKIAQLTKVIYQLNTKNEDKEFDMADQADHFETEIEQVLKEAAQRMNSMKAALDTKAMQDKSDEITRELTQRFEKQQAALQAEFDAYKRSAQDREAALQKASTTQMDGLRAEVATLRAECQRVGDELATSRNGASAALADVEAARRARDELQRRLDAALGSSSEQAAAAEAQLAAALAEKEASWGERMRRLQADAAAARAKADAERAAEAEARVATLTAEMEAERARAAEDAAAVRAANSASDAAWREKMEDLLQALEGTKRKLGALSEECGAEAARAREARAAVVELTARLSAEAAAREAAEAALAHARSAASAASASGAELQEAVQAGGAGGRGGGAGAAAGGRAGRCAQRRAGVARGGGEADAAAGRGAGCTWCIRDCTGRR